MKLSEQISHAGISAEDERRADPRQDDRQEAEKSTHGEGADLFFELLEEMYSA